ncbi:hypothetical protein PV326_000549 [Microctonus aethiopoides]|nr:hypothetical protein PV326_000549 [Microctonus aethiopoides]
MDTLMNDLGNMSISNGQINDALWDHWMNLINKIYVPQQMIALTRPCDEKDYENYRNLVDKYFDDIQSLLTRILPYTNLEQIMTTKSSSSIKTIGMHLILIIGEHSVKNVWNNPITITKAINLSLDICKLFNVSTLSQLFTTNSDIFDNILLMLRPKLLKDIWKTYPSAVLCYKWLIHQIEIPGLQKHLFNVLPTALIIYDDFVPENRVIALECIDQILRHSSMQREFIDNGYLNVIYDALERLTHEREVRYIIPLYGCITRILTNIELVNDTINFEWSKRDDIIATLLDNMELEQNLELRHAYMTSLPQLLTNISCAKWCERLTRILAEYCEHHTDLRTLRVTLQTAETVLTLFHIRIPAHCTILYSAFLKLHFDLMETPTFDEEIIRCLERCIHLLYKLTPTIGSSIIRDDRMRTIMKNSLHIVCPDDTKYCIWRLPVWGSYWILLWGDYKFPHNTIQYYMKKYKSKIIGCWLGPAYTIILNDYVSVKEVLSRKEFDGRLHELYPAKARAFGKKLGIFFNDGWVWQEQRRFALHNLRNFGFGRRHFQVENELIEELNILIDTIKNGPVNQTEKEVINGDQVLFPTILFPISANMIWTIMSGERLDRSNHELLRKLCHSACCFQKGGDTTGGAVSITGWLSYFGNLFGFRDFINGNQGIIDFVKNYIDNMKNNDSTENLMGFLPTYWREMKNNSFDNENFSEEQLIMIAVDFMFPALSAVPSTITHYFKYMMHHPDVMKRAQDEIINVVGRERLPNWDDRKELPFTEATIREVLRMETLTPWSVAHKCLQTTTLQDYIIPVDTIIVTNLSAMHSDKDFWGDPEVFRPERFLSDDGKNLGKDWSLPFGFGRRLCAGETFARFILFEVIATILQQFNLSMIDGQPCKLDDKIPGIIVQPKTTWIRISERL